MRVSIILSVALVLAACTTVGVSTPSVLASRDSGQGGAEAQAISHYLTSVILERTGDFEGAIEELRRAADLYPLSEAIQLKLLSAYIQLEDYDNASVMMLRALESDPDNVRLHIGLGRVYIELDEMEKAIESFERATELDPKSERAYRFLVQIEEATNDMVGAVGVYERLLDLSPESAFLHYSLGRSLLEIGDIDGARASLEEALRLDPDLSPAEYLLASVYVQHEEFEKAITLFEHFLVDNPRTAGARVSVAGALGRLERHGEAIHVLTGLIESAETEPEHHIERMFLFLLTDEIEDPSLAIVPSRVPILGTLLKTLIRKQAGEPYQEMVLSIEEIDGDLDSECNLYLNDILVLFGVQESGAFFAEQLQGLLDEGISSSALDTIMGRTLMSMDRDAEAEVVLTRILDRYGPDKWIHFYLATVYENLDRSRDTEKHLRACLEIDPDDPDVMNFLGYVFAENNIKLDEAEELLGRALDKDPDNGFYLDSLGWIYYQKGDGKRAVELIVRAIRSMNTDDAILRDHLGDAYLLQGDVSKALPEWRRALRLDPELEGVKEKIEKHEKRSGK